MTGKKVRNIEELKDDKDDRQITMDVTATFSNLEEEQQAKFEFNTEMYDKFKALKFKLRMWGNKLKLHNLRHFQHLKSLHAFQEYYQHFVLLTKKFDDRQDFKNIWNMNSCCVIYLKRQTLNGFQKFCTRNDLICNAMPIL